jgi:hypothetical protein
MHSVLQTIIGCAAALLISGDAAATEVMILGTYHMASPGLDLHNVKADDVLLPKRQTELVQIATSLARFRPTLIAVESPAKGGAAVKVEKYHQYLEDRLGGERNEVAQIGFRLGKVVGVADVWGIDVEGDFPYEAVQKFAQAHAPLGDRLDAMSATIERMLDGLNRVLKTGTIGAGLRYLNDPARIAQGNEFYRALLQFGDGAEQPGAALLDAWQARNNAICARLVQKAKKDDRIVVVYGSGHAYLLRQCVREMPGWRLVEANDYLPQ